MKTNIKVLGTGCSKCKTLEKLTHDVITENNFDVELQNIQDIAQILSFGVMMTPALVINEKVIFSGRVPAKKELKEIIEKNI